MQCWGRRVSLTITPNRRSKRSVIFSWLALPGGGVRGKPYVEGSPVRILKPVISELFPVLGSRKLWKGVPLKERFPQKCWSLLSEGVVGLMLYRAQNARLLWRFLAMARKKLRSRVTSAAAQYFQRARLVAAESRAGGGRARACRWAAISLRPRLRLHPRRLVDERRPHARMRPSSHRAISRGRGRRLSRFSCRRPC